MRRRFLGIVLVAAVALGGVACTEGSDPASSPDGGAPAEPDSVAYKLAVIHGDSTTEPEFQRVLDCVRASGIEGGETEVQIGVTLVASWEQSGKADTLLAWAQAFC